MFSICNNRYIKQWNVSNHPETITKGKLFKAHYKRKLIFHQNQKIGENLNKNNCGKFIVMK